MQRVFDVENEKDMADLWDILPESIFKIELRGDSVNLAIEDVGTRGLCLKINWHDKTEIIRPLKEATKEDIGKLCKFWDKREDKESICILSGFEYDGAFVDDHSWCWSHCRRLTKEEIEEFC